MKIKCADLVPRRCLAGFSRATIHSEHHRPRNDRQLLRSLLSEGEFAPFEQPEAVINYQAPTVGCHQVSEPAHGCTCNAWSSSPDCPQEVPCQILELVAKPREQHLHAPSFSEILDADKSAWTTVTETSLAPRPMPPKQDPPKRKPELPKPLPKKPKPDSPMAELSRNTSQPSKTGKWNNTWLRKHQDGKGICMRFNMNKCKSGKTCRFAHQCSIPKANGEPCGGFHTAAK